MILLVILVLFVYLLVWAREFATRYDERSISNPTHKVIKIARVLIYVVIYLYDFSDCSVESTSKRTASYGGINCTEWFAFDRILNNGYWARLISFGY